MSEVDDLSARLPDSIRKTLVPFAEEKLGGLSHLRAQVWADQHNPGRLVLRQVERQVGIWLWLTLLMLVFIAALIWTVLWLTHVTFSLMSFGPVGAMVLWGIWGVLVIAMMFNVVVTKRMFDLPWIGDVTFEVDQKILVIQGQSFDIGAIQEDVFLQVMNGCDHLRYQKWSDDSLRRYMQLNWVAWVDGKWERTLLYVCHARQDHRDVLKHFAQKVGLPVHVIDLARPCDEKLEHVEVREEYWLGV